MAQRILILAAANIATCPRPMRLLESLREGIAQGRYEVSVMGIDSDNGAKMPQIAGIPTFSYPAYRRRTRLGELRLWLDVALRRWDRLSLTHNRLEIIAHLRAHRYDVVICHDLLLLPALFAGLEAGDSSAERGGAHLQDFQQPLESTRDKKDSCVRDSKERGDLSAQGLRKSSLGDYTDSKDYDEARRDKAYKPSYQNAQDAESHAESCADFYTDFYRESCGHSLADSYTIDSSAFGVGARESHRLINPHTKPHTDSHTESCADLSAQPLRVDFHSAHPPLRVESPTPTRDSNPTLDSQALDLPASHTNLDSLDAPKPITRDFKSDSNPASKLAPAPTSHALDSHPKAHHALESCASTPPHTQIPKAPPPKPIAPPKQATAPAYTPKPTNAPRTKVIFDAREFYPWQHTSSLRWRLLFQRFNAYLCATYAPRADRILSVSPSFCALYKRHFGLDVELFTSLPPFYDLKPSPINPRQIRILYHGALNQNRDIHKVITLCERLQSRFCIDFIFTGGEARYRKRIESRIVSLQKRGCRVRVLPPVSLAQIVPFGNAYDIGLLYIPPHNVNLLATLPNKLFEYIQSRLALLLPPIDSVLEFLREEGVCNAIVAEDFSIDSLAHALNSLSSEDIARLKAAAHAVASTLHYARNATRIQHILRELESTQ